MFGWLSRLFSRPDPLERGLFAYHDGKRKRLADPLVTGPALEKAGGKDWSDNLAVIHAVSMHRTTGKLAEVAVADQDRAVGELVRITREAFAIAPVDDQGSGLSGAECLNVLAAYLVFIAALREKWGPLVNSPARPASPKEVPTAESSECGSTAVPGGVNA